MHRDSEQPIGNHAARHIVPIHGLPKGSAMTTAYEGSLFCPIHGDCIRTEEGDCLDCGECEMGEPDVVIFAGPRRCPRHGEAISSDDGMFDGVCNACEGEMSEEAEKWEYNPENLYRKHCGDDAWGQPLGPLTVRGWAFSPYSFKTCVVRPEDDIPF